MPAPGMPLAWTESPGLLLISCSEEMAEAWCPIYQKSLDLHTVPSIWKNSTIIPVPKKACSKENRPVALTSVVTFTHLFVCLLVCLFFIRITQNTKTTSTIFMKLGGKV